MILHGLIQDVWTGAFAALKVSGMLFRLAINTESFREEQSRASRLTAAARRIRMVWVILTMSFRAHTGCHGEYHDQDGTLFFLKL